MDPPGGRAFSDWYGANHARLITSLVLIAGNVHDARDAVDEACARALAAWSRVGTMASPSGWAYRVALNVLRRRRRRSVLEHRLLARQTIPTDVPGPAGEIWQVVQGLPGRQRTAVVLRYVADLTETDIARTMGISRSTVSSTLADARRNLSTLLDDDPSFTEAK